MKHWARFKKFLLVLFCTVVSLVVLFFICEFAFELKFQWTERQYIKNPTSENLFILCDQYADMNSDVAQKYIPLLCIDNQIADAPSFLSKSSEEQQACKDEFLSIYVAAYLHTYDLVGFKQALLQSFDLIQNDDMLYFNILWKLNYAEPYESASEKIKVLDILYEAARENGDTNQILSVLVFADIVCVKYNLGQEKTEYYKQEYDKVYQEAYPELPPQNIDGLWHYDENGNVIYDGVQ